jgi:hypothetical protein
MSQAFWTSTSKYGIVHKASRRDQSVAPGCLVVFVHGIFGDCSRTWGSVPEWILESGGIDVDVISFAYPSQIWQRCSIPVAAEDLRTWLETEFCNHRHLLFVTHSTGDLIVKQMLRQAYGEVKAQLDNRAFDISSSVWLRTRHVINIAVPHSGGSPFITAFAKVTYHSVFPLMAPISATQAEIRDAIVAAIHSGSERPRQMVITGAAGVGKSLVVRMIAWRLGRDYLAAGQNGHPLPLFIPLQQVTLTG